MQICLPPAIYAVYGGGGGQKPQDIVGFRAETIGVQLTHWPKNGRAKAPLKIQLHKFPKQPFFYIYKNTKYPKTPTIHYQMPLYGKLQ